MLLPSFGLGSPCQLLVTGGLGTCATVTRGGWTGTRFASARDRRRQMEQDEEEEIALAVVLALKRLNRL